MAMNWYTQLSPACQAAATAIPEFILGILFCGMIALAWKTAVWIHRSTFRVVFVCRVSDVLRFLFSAENNKNNREYVIRLMIHDNSTRLDYDDGQCAICLGPHVKKSRTTCGHVFCLKCLVQWSRVKLECPTCKHPFDAFCKGFQPFDNNYYALQQFERGNLDHIFIELLLVVLLPAAIIGLTVYFAAGWIMLKILNYAVSSQTVTQFLAFRTTVNSHGAVPVTGH
ncbi:uncharacterized protein LOC124205768 [Daphnia pulex]|uniref:uncharacterized protein LOC124205768 n=1 Tax=Daphnia pulex TaxID=6669 RepID=UPI001EDFED3D|nr:uncharacterized protein LOC124205768 [Daphnia pulex]